MSKIAFNTANFVARVSDYRFQLRNWMAQHDATIAQTDENAWRDICCDIAEAGYHAVEVWEAHAAPEVMNKERARTWRSIMDDNGLTPVAYAGGLRPETIEICQWLGISHIDGGLRINVGEANHLCRESGVGFNFENHPQKSAAEILAQINGGSDVLGVCIDTGWLGTQGVDAPTIIRELGPLIRHLHLKDVSAAGGHETCVLGSGVVDIAGCVAAAKEIGYQGWYSWEDEPENRNPLQSAVQNREYIENLLNVKIY